MDVGDDDFRTTLDVTSTLMAMAVAWLLLDGWSVTTTTVRGLVAMLCLVTVGRMFV